MQAASHVPPSSSPTAASPSQRDIQIPTASLHPGKTWCPMRKALASAGAGISYCPRKTHWSLFNLHPPPVARWRFLSLRSIMASGNASAESEQSADAAVRTSASRKPPGTAGTGRSRWSPHGMCHPSTPPYSQVPCHRSSQAQDPVPMLPMGVHLPLGRVPIAAASALPRHGSLGGESINSPSTEMKNSSAGLLLPLV